MLKGGYSGKILRIDLSNQSAKEEVVSEELAKKYLGGVGFAFKYLYDEVKPGTPALDKGNKLMFSVGPLTATGVPCTSRMAVSSKSPLTNTIACALAGGHFPAMMKRAGYDMIIVEGKAEKPVYVAISDGEVRFKKAEQLKGMTTTDTQLFIKDELRDHNYEVTCIGPAGERQVLLSSVISGRRAAGRKGLGAVMGSKNLKAIAVLGSSKPSIADQSKFKKALKTMKEAMRDSDLYTDFSKTGTGQGIDTLTTKGILPIRNYSATGMINMVNGIGFDVQDATKISRSFCADCPVGCSQARRVDQGPYAGFLTEGPEFESSYALGAAVGVDYFPAIIAADRLSDEYGIDTMSAGCTIGFAMELYEKGILTDKDTGGIELKFGNHKAMIEMLRQIAYKEGLGATLGEGTKRAAEKIGKGSEYYAMQIKGLELPGYDVRGAKAHGMNYATAYNGADHNKGYAIQEIFGLDVPEKVDRFATKGKGKLTIWNQDVRCACSDCSTLCVFIFDMALAKIACSSIADLVSAVAGVPFTPEEIQQVGERVNNIARLFNIKEGFSRKDDTLPKRIMVEPIQEGASAGHLITEEDFNEMLDEYYSERGWDENGIPKDAKKLELGLK